MAVKWLSARKRFSVIASSSSLGFSLIEAMIALTILIFMLMTIGYLLVSTLETTAEARRLTAAVALAQDQIERLRSIPYANVVNGNDGPLSESGELIGPVRYFDRTWTAAASVDPPGIPPVGTSTLAVQVQWGEKDGPRQIQFRTILSQ